MHPEEANAPPAMRTPPEKADTICRKGGRTPILNSPSCTAERNPPKMIPAIRSGWVMVMESRPGPILSANTVFPTRRYET